MFGLQSIILITINSIFLTH